jgi:hypothetical protein
MSPSQRYTFICPPSGMSLSQASALVLVICLSSYMSPSQISAFICLPSDMSLCQVSALVLAICMSSNMSPSQISSLVSFICLPSDMSLYQVSALVFAICLSSNMSASQISFLVSFFCTAWHLTSLANIVPVGVSSKCLNYIAQFSFPYLIIYNYLYVGCTAYKGSQRDVVYLGWPIVSLYMSPNAGGGRKVAGPQPMSTVVDLEPK